MLFVPFKELKKQQSLKNVKDRSLGMGLACSKAISKAMGGDLMIKQSQRNLSVFGFKIPVRVKNLEDSIKTINKKTQF